MNTENLDQSQNKEIPENNPNPNSSLIPEETNKLLVSLLKHRLEEKITKLETKEKEDEETLKFVYKKFKGYISLLDVFTTETIIPTKTNTDSTKKTVFLFIPPRHFPRTLFIFFLRGGLLCVLFPDPPVFSVR